MSAPRRRLQCALPARELGGRAAAIWAQGGDALVVIDAASGRIVAANPAAEGLFGLSEAQLRHMSYRKLFAGASVGVARGCFGAAIQGMIERSSDVELKGVRGAQLPAEVRFCTFREGGRTRVLAEIHDVSAFRQAEAALRRSNWALAAVMRASRAVVHTESDIELMQAVCEAITSGEIFTLAWIGLARHDEQKSVFMAGASGPGLDYVKGLKVSWGDDEMGHGPTGTCIRTGQTIINNDTAHNPLLRPWAPRAAEHGLRASLATPLSGNGDVIGALTVYANRTDVFGADEVRLFEQFALGLGMAMKARRDQRKYRKAMEQMVGALAAAAERRDPYTAGHQRRVAELALSIAREMGLDAARCRVIWLAGLVHDIGKINVPAEILNKPGALSVLEFELVKTHVKVSRELLQGVDFPWALAEIAGQHHERLDGSGYPQGLHGDSIRLEARIIAVADILEAISSHRPYRPARGMRVGLDELRRQRGVQLDAAAVDAALRLCSRGRVAM